MTPQTALLFAYLDDSGYSQRIATTCSQHFSKSVILRIARLQHIGDELDRVGIIFVLLQKFQHLPWIVIAGFDTIGCKLAFALRFGYQQYRVVRHAAESLGCSLWFQHFRFARAFKL